MLVDDNEVIKILAWQQREVLFTPTTLAKHRKLTEMDFGAEEEDIKPCRTIISQLMPVKSGNIDMRDVISLDEPDIDSLTYDKSNAETDIPLPRHEKFLLCIFRYYLLHCSQ